MKIKLLYFIVVAVIITIINFIFYEIANVSALGNAYSVTSYLYMPLFPLFILFLLLLFLNNRKASMVYALLNLTLILVLLSINSLESQDFLWDVLVQDSRFSYVILSLATKYITTENLLLNMTMYTSVFSLYYFVIFTASITFHKWFLNSFSVPK